MFFQKNNQIFILKIHVKHVSLCSTQQKSVYMEDI